MNNIDLTKLTSEELKNLEKALKGIKESNKVNIEDSEEYFTIKIPKTSFLNEKIISKKGTTYIKQFTIGSSYGTQKMNIGSKTYGLTLSVLEY